METQMNSAYSEAQGFFARTDRFFGRLNLALGYIVALSMGLFALSIALDLAMRRLGLGNMPWLYEVIEYVLYAGVFLATPWVLREGAHVRVDLFLTALSPQAALAMEKLLNILGAAVSLALCYYGWRAGLEAFIGNSRQFKTLVVHDSWLMGIFTVALLLLAIEFLLRLGRADAAAGTADDPLNKAGF
jgi:TRAP-type C4-dicarboxylate transport system permease small subunit